MGLYRTVPCRISLIGPVLSNIYTQSGVVVSPFIVVMGEIYTPASSKYIRYSDCDRTYRVTAVHAPPGADFGMCPDRGISRSVGGRGIGNAIPDIAPTLTHRGANSTVFLSGMYATCVVSRNSEQSPICNTKVQTSIPLWKCPPTPSPPVAFASETS